MADERASVEIIVPGLFGPLPGVAPEQRFPFLDTLLGRARRLAAPLQTDTVRTLLDLCGRPVPADAEPPTGALAALGRELPAELRAWACADPVHLRADRDRLLLFDQTHFELDDSDCDAFRDAFNAHFADRDIRLHIAARRHWFVSLPEPPRVRTATLEEVSGRAITSFMPRGADASWLRALLNEIQMLFHDLDVNRRRAERGRLPVSGLWLHGFGLLPDASELCFPASRVIGDNAVLRGIAALLEHDHETVQRDPLRAGDLIVWDDILPAVLEADPDAWVKAVERFSRWLEPQVGTAPRKQRFVIRSADGQAHECTPAMRKHFWKRGWRLARNLLDQEDIAHTQGQ